TKPVDNRLAVFETENCGFNAYCAGPAIKNIRNLFPELLDYVFRPGRAYIAKRVCTGCRKGKRNILQKLPCNDVVRAANTNCLKTRCYQIRDDWLFLQYNGEWSRPEKIR